MCKGWSDCCHAREQSEIKCSCEKLGQKGGGKSVRHTVPIRFVKIAKRHTVLPATKFEAICDINLELSVESFCH